MDYSEQLWTKEKLTEEQNALVRKICESGSPDSRTGRQPAQLCAAGARRENRSIDLGVLIRPGHANARGAPPAGKIQVSLVIDKDLPRVHGNANQLFQGFVEIIENAMDALEEVGGGIARNFLAKPRVRDRV